MKKENKLTRKSPFRKRTIVAKTLDRYRDVLLADNILNYEFVGFYQREFFIFDNFSSFAIEYKGVVYPTIEHAYQSLKFVDTAPEIAKEIAECHSAVDAKRIARRNVDKQNKDWLNINISIMEELLRAKIDQHPYVKQKLLETKDLIICEDSPYDSFWGIGKDRNGENWLGKLWMKLRDEIKESLEEENKQ